MPQPNRNQLHLDALLSDLSVAYIQAQTQFVAPIVFPMVPVAKQSDKYNVYRKDDWFRDEAKPRADGTESAGSGYNLDREGYDCEVNAFHKDIGYQSRANADGGIDLDDEAVRFVTNRMLLRMEVDWATKFFSTGKWAKDITGVADTPVEGTSAVKWSDYETSDPREDIEAGKEGVLSTTGFEANTLVLGYSTFRKLKSHPDIREQVKYTSSATVTAEILAAMFDIERVLVCKSVRATNKEGGTPTYAFNHGKHALLCHVAPSPGLLTPSAGYTFGWDGVSGGMGSSVGVSNFHIDHLKADRVEAEAAWDHKVVGSDLGWFWNNIGG